MVCGDSIDECRKDKWRQQRITKPTKIKLGVSPGHRENLEPDVARVFTETLERLTATGDVEIVTVDIDDVVHRAHQISQTLVFGEFEEALRHYLADTEATVSVDTLFDQVGDSGVAALMRGGRSATSEKAYHQALTEQRGLQRTYVNRLSTAPLLEAQETTMLNGRAVPTFGTLMRHGPIAGTLGLPGISLPAGCGATTGLPVGVEITACPGTDTHLLGVGTALAEVMPKVQIPHA